MDTIAIKEEIAQIVNHLPESELVYVLLYLRQVDSKPDNTAQRAHYLQKILQEDRELLTRLAQ